MVLKVSVPVGTAGNVTVEKFTITKEDERLGQLRAVISSSSRGRYVPAGTYIHLLIDGQIVMSDTPDEMDDQRDFIRNAKGHILINGLGLGVTLQLVLEKPEVTKVTVIEKNPYVIALVGYHYQQRYSDRLEILLGDAFTYKPPKGIRYGAVWHEDRKSVV